MSRFPARRGLLAGALLLAAAAQMAGTPGAASATGAATGRVVDVVIGEGGLSAPSTLPEGAVTLRVRSTRPAVALLLVRLRTGHSLDVYLRDLVLTSSLDLEERKAASRAVEAAADQFGGAVVTSAAVVACTQVLPHGRYYLVAFEYSSATATPIVREVSVEGFGGRAYPAVDGSIVHRRAGTHTRLEVSGADLPGHGRFRVFNASGGLNEAVFVPVAPGTTEDEVRAVFDALRNGTPPPSMPFRGRPVGLAPLSPGRSAVLHVELPAGPYLLLSHIVDPRTGHPRAYDGAFHLTSLT
ncbi:hypothetical protein [Nonomuraea sp. NPDC050643]|uniref:hypothetical protein n=1 Tax=Nonomuraea sp. NPDC050643 TaxID=3155660 RepID=UPI0033CED809